MYCSNCGTQLPEDASFCLRCGEPQKEGGKAIELRWETCEIDWRIVEEAQSRTTSKIKWVANAIGPNGKYLAGETSVFEGRVGNNFPFTYSYHTKHIDSKTNEKNIIARRALDDFIAKLSKDGWDYVGKYDDFEWALRFRRRVR